MSHVDRPADRPVAGQERPLAGEPPAGEEASPLEESRQGGGDETLREGADEKTDDSIRPEERRLTES